MSAREKTAVLVTGGAGFIGTNFIKHLLREHPDWEIVNLDKLTYAGNPENLADVAQDPRYRFVRGDIADRELVDSLFAAHRFDLVANLAAESHVDRSILDPAPFIETNVKGTQVLLEAASQYGVERFLQVSTDEVYGSLGPDDPPFTEETHLAPNSPYSASKAAADLLCRAYRRTYGLPVVISRCSNNYGPYQFPEKFMPTVITNALEDKPVPIYGDGLNIRDWIYVEDHCRALDLLLQKGAAGRGLQHRRRRGEDQPGAGPHHLKAPRQAGKPHHLRQGPPRPRPPLRHEPQKACGRAWLAAANRLCPRPCPHGGVVPGQPALVGAGKKRGIPALR